MIEDNKKDVSKKRAFYGGYQNSSKKQRMAAANARGGQGILCSCLNGREREAVKEALNLLNEWAEKLYPADKPTATMTTAPSSTNECASSAIVQDTLDEEIRELKKQSKKGQTGYFIPLDSGVKGIALLQLNPNSNIDIIRIVNAVFDHVLESNESCSRYIARLIPLQHICFASPEELKQAIEPFISATFQLLPPAMTTFAIDFKKRNTAKIEPMAFIDACCDLITKISPDFKVNLNQPDEIVLLQIFRSTIGFSLVTGPTFRKYRKYNLSKLLEEEESTSSSSLPVGTVAPSTSKIPGVENTTEAMSTATEEEK